jgi:aspartate/methionine/tyrosine aminotransferase
VTAVTLKPLARTPLQMPGSGIREIVHLALTLPGVIRLEVGEPDFPTPPHIVEAAARAAREGFTRYTPSAGLSSLREMIAARYADRRGHPVDPSQVTVTVGGVQGMAAACVAVLDPGDEVLVPDPGWPNYAMAARLREAVPVGYPLRVEDGFVPRVEDLEAHVSPRTKMLVLNSPANPTGAVFPADRVAALLEFARRHHLYVLADEVYEELVYEGRHVSPARWDPERVIGIYSLSKTYAMTGWRVGFVIASETVSRVLAKIQEPLISCVPSVTQKAAEAALAGPQQCVVQMRDAYRARRDAVVAILRAHGLHRYIPQGAFYILVDIRRSGLPSREFALRLLREQGVAVAPGSAFGQQADGYVRVSLASRLEDLREGVSRLCACAAAPVAG